MHSINQNKKHGYLTLIGGVCIHLFCGNLYLWGNINTYVVSYFQIKFGDTQATSKIAQMVLPISFLMQKCCNPLGAYL